jgi:hypothetical protein
LLREDSGNRQLWMLADAPPTAPFAAVIPFDAHMPERVEAALHLWLSLTASAPPPVAPLTAQQRRRLILMLRALDGWQQHASYREIAAVLVDPLVRSQSRRGMADIAASRANHSSGQGCNSPYARWLSRSAQGRLAGHSMIGVLGQTVSLLGLR